jgi:hypothetical protein
MTDSPLFDELKATTAPVDIVDTPEHLRIAEQSDEDDGADGNMTLNGGK